MLLRLHVRGLRNLADVELPLGPFTCLAGRNGAGKSNLLSAARLLGLLADRSLADAVAALGLGRDATPLFRRDGERIADELHLEADLLVPGAAVDELGQRGEASITLLRYTLALGRRPDRADTAGLAVLREELHHLRLRDARAHLGFPCSVAWRESVLEGRRSGAAFLSTEGGHVEVHQDGGQGSSRVEAARLPRTVLSSARAAETPTALCARRELQSWRHVHLEPTALRTPGELPAWLRRARHVGGPAALARIAQRLAALQAGIDVGPAGDDLDLRALGDGALRFLALATLAEDHGCGLLCIEEPENGIHPDSIPVLLELLRSLAVDVERPAGADNPLRQVLIATHSPGLVSLSPEDSVVGVTPPGASVRWLSDTWRARVSPDHALSREELLPYVQPSGTPAPAPAPGVRRRVVDREDLQLPLFPEPG
jgi:predicted ATPase